jgi:hypothetical protein
VCIIETGAASQSEGGQAKTTGRVAGQVVGKRGLKMSNLQVANTILEQLGGRKFLAMTGASNLTGRPDGLSFKIGRNSGKVTHVRVTLTPGDEYEMEFLKIRGTKVDRVAFANALHADQLAGAFESRTGMAVSL